MLLLGLIAVASFFVRGAQPVTAATPPGAPGTPVAIPAEAAATVYWTAAPGTVTGYQVVASPGGASTTVSGTTLYGTVPGLSDNNPYTFTVTADNSGTPGPASTASNPVVPGRGVFVAVTPARVLDTRSSSPLGPGGVRTLSLDGAGGLPSGGMNAVVLNVTATNTTATSWLTVWPAGVPRPTASNLNWTAGRTVPNLVEVALGAGDQISIANAAGSADVLVDAEGYVATPTASVTPGGFYPLVPSRVLDTRIGLGAPKAQLCANQTITVQIAGQGGVPSSGVTAVVMNVTLTQTVVAPSFVTVWPAGSPRPNVSNLNFVPGQIVANRVVVPLGSGGAVNFYDYAGHTDVMADVNGWFTSASGSGTRFVGLPPTRILDTRANHVIWAGGTMTVIAAPAGGVPSPVIIGGPSAVVLNVTITNPSAASWLTIYPLGSPRPNTSDINFAARQTVANLVVIQLGTVGEIDLFNPSGQADVIIDVVGWYG